MSRGKSDTTVSVKKILKVHINNWEEVSSGNDRKSCFRSFFKSVER